MRDTKQAASLARSGWWKRACAVCALCATTSIGLRAQTFNTVHSFDFSDGSYPQAALIQATDGNLYGTALTGGPADVGTIFRITPDGELTTLYTFSGADGANPEALVQAADGNFYGTTNYDYLTGVGTVFKITSRGDLTILYRFCSQSSCSDGANPSAGLIQATDGNFYGTTSADGANGRGGTVFKIGPSGKLTTLYSFCSQSNCTDGEDPTSALVQSNDGNFYGTTTAGGANNSGTVFKVTPGGVLKTLYSFCPKSGCSDGVDPSGPLLQGADGNFYSTTAGGGADGNYGTIFRVTPSGTLTTLYSFCPQSGCTDGESPYAGLVEGSDGNFYGTTSDGGANDCSGYGCGTIFKITPSGTLTTLYSFCSRTDCTDGEYPFGGLVQDTNGKLYGTTVEGGASFACPDGCGTLFRLTARLGQFVETRPGSGKVGAAIDILGTALTGATSVTFDGTPATFTVASSSLITTTVPQGAATGEVEVTTPHGTLRSNVRFRVLP